MIYPNESYAVIGACFSVYNEKGCGFLEPVYHECLAVEFELRRIPYQHEPQFPLSYKGRILTRCYSPDFSCWQKVIVEVKACSQLVDEHVAQVLNYLHATGYELGLLVNFGHYPKLEYKRVARTRLSTVSIRADSRHSRAFS